jgi:hypothetical protein
VNRINWVNVTCADVSPHVSRRLRSVIVGSILQDNGVVGIAMSTSVRVVVSELSWALTTYRILVYQKI